MIVDIAKVHQGHPLNHDRYQHEKIHAELIKSWIKISLCSTVMKQIAA